MHLTLFLSRIKGFNPFIRTLCSIHRNHPDAERQEIPCHSNRDIASTMQSFLKIPAIEEHVYLGCTVEERKFQHRVHYNVELSFENIPSACLTDTLDKTPCYAEIAQVLSQVSKEKHYATIEHLAHEGMKSLEKYINHFEDLKIKDVLFTVHKLNPPVPSIKGGSLFTLRQTYS